MFCTCITVSSVVTSVWLFVPSWSSSEPSYSPTSLLILSPSCFLPYRHFPFATVPASSSSDLSHSSPTPPYFFPVPPPFYPLLVASFPFLLPPPSSLFELAANITDSNTNDDQSMPHRTTLFLLQGHPSRSTSPSSPSSAREQLGKTIPNNV